MDTKSTPLTEKQKNCKHGFWIHITVKGMDEKENKCLWLVHKCKLCEMETPPYLIRVLEAKK